METVKLERPEQKFAIFRAKDAVPLAEADCMTVEPFTPLVEEYLRKAYEEGLAEGSSVRVLVNIPGFSLVHVWFKANLPLPLHTHDADCLYYIVAGSIQLGTNKLAARDSFLIPADVPYSFVPGPDGVEFLEIRHATKFNAVNRANGKAFWEKALDTVRANRERWKTARMPA